MQKYKFSISFHESEITSSDACGVHPLGQFICVCVFCVCRGVVLQREPGFDVQC